MLNSLKMSNFIVAKQQSPNLEAVSKGTTIISDLRSFFSENAKNRAINSIMGVMEQESQGTGTLISRMSDVVHLLPCRLAEQ